MKRVVILGGTGFIGRNMAQHYSKLKDYEVYATYFKSKPSLCEGVKFIKADLTKAEDVDSAIKGMDIVIQAAATTSGSHEIVNKPYYHVTDNAVMNSLIFRSAYENQVEHVIFFSCTVMYQPGKIPVREIDFDANDDIFPSYFGVGWTKVYLEKMCEFYSRISNIKFSVLRHSNVYGPYDKYDLVRSHVFGASITKVLAAEEGTDIVVWGEGKEKRDLIHVSDLIEAVALCVEKQREKFEIFNIGSGEAISIADLVKKIILLANKRVGIHYDITKATIPTELALNCTKARELIGWAPTITLENGIKMTIDWYLDNIK